MPVNWPCIPLSTFADDPGLFPEELYLPRLSAEQSESGGVLTAVDRLKNAHLVDVTLRAGVLPCTSILRCVPRSRVNDYITCDP